MNNQRTGTGGIYALMLAIAALVAIRALALVFGFSAVAGDEYSRVLLAASWADLPFLYENSSIAWLPGHFYMLGLALKVHYDLFLTPRLVSLLFASLSLVMLYLISARFFNRGTAIISILLIGLLPVHVYLSLTPAVDTVYVAMLVSFLYFFLLWQEKHASGYLLISALLLAFMMSLRYESWFIAVSFCCYLAFCWLRTSPRPMFPPVSWLVAIVIVSIPPCTWLTLNYLNWGDPFYFMTVFTGTSAPGPVAEIIPQLGYIELLIKHGGLIIILALAGLVVARRLHITGFYPYLLLSLTPFVVLTLLKPEVGSAYPPRYSMQYLIPLSPFAAYMIWIAWTAVKKPSLPRWSLSGNELPLIFALYNIWLVYLALSHMRSSVIVVLAVLGMVLSYRVLSFRHWRNLSLGIAPFVVLLVLHKTGVLSQDKDLHAGIYSVALAIFYILYLAWNFRGGQGDPSTPHQWRLTGVGLFSIMCLYNFAATYVRIPHHEPPGSMEAGWKLRQLYTEGILAPEDKVLIEVGDDNVKVIQVISNYPGNFILDRSFFGEDGRKSFLVGAAQKPHSVSSLYTNYEAIDYPNGSSSAHALQGLTAKTGVRLAMIKDPVLGQIISRDDDFYEAGSVGGYRLYLKAKH